ncbi:MAG: hypothetical protein GTO55_11820 [Armatimonadetes bacterium]|nr:hypothetical protein [Armatimonadota bacterium]NIM24899.1 hypothetical protein [Armatimonadota bacterium]NIM68790.1 hypothetical protein [Armatimonadota bacterium]NIN06985.1 hypothetical protein [Armatimonadota bacterium]NIO98889.1 hypothetical protein [Armatimonadota bacterium]
MKRVCWEEAVVLVLGMVLGATIVLAMGSVWAGNTPVKQQVPEVVRAHRFEVVDDAGRVRAALGVRHDGIGLFLFDKEEKQRILMTVTEDGGQWLLLSDEEGHPRAALHGGGSIDETYLRLSDKEGKATATMDVLLGSPSVNLRDKEGRTRATLGLSHDAHPSLELCDEKGKSRAGLMVSNDGRPGLVLYDVKGEEIAAGLIATREGDALLIIRDRKGKNRASLGMGQHGANLMLEDADGKIRALLGALHPDVFPEAVLLGKQAESSLVLFDREGEVLWKAPPY